MLGITTTRVVEVVVIVRNAVVSLMMVLGFSKVGEVAQWGLAFAGRPVQGQNSEAATEEDSEGDVVI